MLNLHLTQIDALDKAIAEIEKEVGLGLEPFRQAAKLLSTMPGLSAVSAHVVVAEIGIDMSRFATPGHLLSWAVHVPAQRRERGQAPQHPAAPRRQVAQDHYGPSRLAVDQKSKASYLQAQFHRLRARRGAYEGHHRRGRFDAHSGVAHAARRHRVARPRRRSLRSCQRSKKPANRLIRRLQQIGYIVSATPA